MAKIDDFEKRYVTSASFQSGDDILVTEENIEPLRRALKKYKLSLDFWTSNC